MSFGEWSVISSHFNFPILYIYIYITSNTLGDNPSIKPKNLIINACWIGQQHENFLLKTWFCLLFPSPDGLSALEGAVAREKKIKWHLKHHFSAISSLQLYHRVGFLNLCCNIVNLSSGVVDIWPREEFPGAAVRNNSWKKGLEKKSLEFYISLSVMTVLGFWCIFAVGTAISCSFI